MKLFIRKKQLGSLCSFLVLTLFQPEAVAEESESSNLLVADEIQVDTTHRLTKERILSPRHRLVSEANNKYSFTKFHHALEQLEEQHQDKIDAALDTYEEHIKFAKTNPQNEQVLILQAKQNAQYALSELKTEHRTNQELLKRRFLLS